MVIISQRIKRILEGKLKIIDCIDYFLQECTISRALKEAGLSKQQGYPPVDIFSYLLRLVFYGLSLYEDQRQGYIKVPFKKDTVYRFMRNPDIHWIYFTTINARTVLDKIIKLKGANEEDMNFGGVISIDDSDFMRSKSNFVEYLSKRHSHILYTYFKGFKLSALSYFLMGISLPVNGVLVSTPKKEKIIYEPPHQKARNGSSGRFRRAVTKGTVVIKEQLETAAFFGLKIRYVLFDSWYAEPVTVKRVLDLGFDVIGMLKAKGKTRYRYNGTLRTVLEIFQILKKNNNLPAKGDIFFSVKVLAHIDEQEFPVKLVYVRNYNKKREYCCLICSDLSLSDQIIQKLYKVRWEIEVIFRVLKSPYIGLVTRNQSLSLDAVSAHVALCLTVYQMLSWLRVLSENETISILEQFQKTRIEIFEVAELNRTLTFAKNLIDSMSESSDQNLEKLADTCVKQLLNNQHFMEMFCHLPEWAFQEVKN